MGEQTSPENLSQQNAFSNQILNASVITTVVEGAVAPRTKQKIASMNMELFLEEIICNENKLPTLPFIFMFNTILLLSLLLDTGKIYYIFIYKGVSDGEEDNHEL